METALKNQIILATDVSYQFPGSERLTLQVPSLSISDHQHTAIIGPSGCGKTTLLRLIAGVLVPKLGSICILGSNSKSLSPKARGLQRLQFIGMVFQEFALLDYLTALDNILLTARLGDFDLKEARSHALELSQRAGIKHVLNRRPNQLSQGERQRIAICRALVTKPKLILCDEPTGNLDTSRSKEIIDLVMSEADKLGATVITVTHDLSILDRFDRTIDLSEIAILEGDQP